MDHISKFIWLMEQASGGLFYIWPISIGLLFFLFYSVGSAIKQKKESFKKNLKFLPLPLVGTGLILISGITFENEPQYTFVAYSALGVTVLLSGLLVYKTIGNRKVSIASSLVIIWYSLWCWFVSVMSITGDWL